MELVPCPYCTAQVSVKRLEKHIANIHTDLVTASESGKQEAAARATELRQRPKQPETGVAKHNSIWCSPEVMALPAIIRRNSPKRRRLYLDAYEAGIDASGIQTVPATFCECYLCGRWSTRPLYRVPLKDGSFIEIGQDCFDTLFGINEQNVTGLRAIVDLET
jgi:hypothetical protein